MNENSKQMETYTKGFRDGFDVGYDMALERMSKLASDRVPPDVNQYNLKQSLDYHYQCQVCGASGISFQVCTHPNCPTRITCGDTTGAIGAGGAVRNLGVGVNGPTSTYRY